MKLNSDILIQVSKLQKFPTISIPTYPTILVYFSHVGNSLTVEMH